MIKRFVALAGLVLCSMGVVQAQVPVTLQDRGGAKIVLGAPGQAYNSGMTTITTGGVAITASTVKVKMIYCRNDSGSGATVLVTDAAAEVYVPTQTMATKSVLLISLSDMGLTMTGVTITAGTNSAIKCQIEGAKQ